ncbi:MAG: hypothetical protein ACRDOK_00750 [Streptosporangiaceae bacterium]
MSAEETPLRGGNISTGVVRIGDAGTARLAEDGSAAGGGRR